MKDHRIPSMLRCLTGLAALLLPSLLFAAGGGEVHQAALSEILWDIGIKVLNVSILGFFAFKFLSKPLNAMVEGRSAKVRQELEEADAGRREAEERLKSFQEKMARIEEEIEALRLQACADIDQEQKILLDESRQAAEHIRQHAKDTIRQEVAKARDELHQEAVHLTLELTEGLIRKDLTTSDQGRLVRQYLEEMEASK